MNVYKQSAIVITLNWVLFPLSFVVNALVARTIGPEGRGVLFLLVGLTGVLVYLFNFGIPSAAAYFYKRNRFTAGQIFTLALLLAVTATGLVYILLFFFADEFIQLFLGKTDQIQIQPVWIWMGILNLLPGLILPLTDVLLIIDGSMSLYTVKRLGSGLTSITFTWFFTLILSWGITGVLLSQLLSSLIPIAVLIIWLRQKGGFLNVRVSMEIIREMLRVGLQQYGVSMIAMVAKRFDAFLITGILSVRDAGYYSIAFTFYEYFSDIPRAMMWPLFSRLADQGEKIDQGQFSRNIRILISLMFLLVLAVGITAPWFIHFVYGDAFLPALGAIWMISPTLVIAPLIVSGNAYLTSKGIPGRVIKASIVATALQVVTSVILLPRIGILGSALGLTINSTIVAIWMVSWMVKSEGFRIRDLLLLSKMDIRKIYFYCVQFARRIIRISQIHYFPRN